MRRQLTTPETISGRKYANALEETWAVFWKCEDAVNVSGISSSMEKNNEITDYLPSGESENWKRMRQARFCKSTKWERLMPPH